ncbi:FMN-binding protein [Cellulomonas biazotea]|uniref:FMN-binding domain-containing protein n=1 Tax=Cellulomonas biazotea TaxID=1709 RepID=A0A402DPT0_9CELL|nr:FMN-binding protein [Cellulomonas biazotea]GCE76135.1 hypothetical protein CBZ_11910 [Cellulomonas biazotea]
MSTSRPTALALAGLTLAAALAGCAADATAADAAADASADQAGTAADAATSAPAEERSPYADGTYEQTATYTSPAGEESIAVSLTLEDGVVTAVAVTPQATNPTSLTFQTDFASAVADQVVGVPVDSLELDVVSGASLTTGGFSDAVDAVAADALG